MTDSLNSYRIFRTKNESYKGVTYESESSGWAFTLIASSSDIPFLAINTVTNSVSVGGSIFLSVPAHPNFEFGL